MDKCGEMSNKSYLSLTLLITDDDDDDNDEPGQNQSILETQFLDKSSYILKQGH